LDRDPKLMCISSWNDHGQVWLQRHPLHLTIQSDAASTGSV
jgi:hypothetical protein